MLPKYTLPSIDFVLETAHFPEIRRSTRRRYPVFFPAPDIYFARDSRGHESLIITSLFFDPSTIPNVPRTPVLTASQAPPDSIPPLDLGAQTVPDTSLNANQGSDSASTDVAVSSSSTPLTEVAVDAGEQPQQDIALARGGTTDEDVQR